MSTQAVDTGASSPIDPVQAAAANEQDTQEIIGQKVFVILNPKSGNAGQGDAIRAAIHSRFAPPQWAVEIHEMTGEEDLAELSQAACSRGAELVVAAGGDGTLLAVANGLINGPVPLGILPFGTGNDLARVLKVPLTLNEALDVITGEHDILTMDVLEAAGRYFLSNVSVGFTPHMMKDTKPEYKKRFGLLAYVWTMFQQSRLFQLERYTLTIDGFTRRIRASEILVSNAMLLEAPPHYLGSPESLTDGVLDAYLITAHTLADYVRLIWDLLRRGGQSAMKFHHRTGQRSIRIDAVHHPQMVQADGEVIGHTPVEIRLIPRALRVIMPKAKPAGAAA